MTIAALLIGQIVKYRNQECQQAENKHKLGRSSKTASLWSNTHGALWTPRNKRNQKKNWTEVTNNSSWSDPNPAGGFTLYCFVCLFLLIQCNMPQMTELHTATRQIKQDVEEKGLHAHKSRWHERPKWAYGWLGMKGYLKPDETTSNKSISSSPSIYNVLRLSFNPNASSGWE